MTPVRFLAAALVLLVSQKGPGWAAEVVAFDLRRTAHAVHGFGVTFWASDDLGDLERVFRELNIRFGRTPRGFYEDCHDEAGYDAYWRGYEDWERIKQRWDLARRCGVKMTLTGWNYPPQWISAVGESIAGHADEYAAMWASLVRAYADRGMKPYAILFGEESECPGTRQYPMWIAPEEYCDLLKRTRQALNRRGLADVRIMAPGCAHLDMEAGNPWVEALDPAAVATLSAWATHGYLFGERGTAQLRAAWAKLTGAIARKDPGRRRPVFVTEYESLSDEPFGTVAWAVRQYADTLEHLNAGAAGTWYFSACGPLGGNSLIRNGVPALSFYCLKTLYPVIPVGARVLPPQGQPADFSCAAFVRGRRLVVALANPSARRLSPVVRLSGVAQLRVTEALAFTGDPGAEVRPGEADVRERGLGEWVLRPVLPPLSTLTIVCDATPTP
ncbi:MAG: hypothetical protein HPY69_06985 [Armatimonadetes bacterium]|nr:hypothetical protein [Armatimonadota bacterium]